MGLDTVMENGVTVTASALGARHPECGSHSQDSALFKPATKRGGARPGSGPKPKPASVVVNPGLGGLRWFGLVVEPRREADVEWRLRDQGFTAVAPQYRTRFDGLLAAYPGYVLAEFDRDDASWRPIVHTVGVKRALGGDPERPTPLPAVQVAWVLAQFGDDGVQRRPVETCRAAPLPTGATVQFVGGVMVGYRGVVAWSDGHEVRVLVDGRPVRTAQAAVTLAGPS
jgi:hypothetical protein